MANHNHAHYLPTSLGGVFGQTRMPDEVIIVDDGSTDDSLAVIGGFQARHRNLRLIRNTSNRGVLYSVQRGLEACHSSHVAFLAADDMFFPDFIELSMARLERYPHAGLCFSAYATLDDATGDVHDYSVDASQGGSFDIRRYPEYMEPAVFRRQLKQGIVWISGNTVIASLEAIRQAGGFRPELRWHTDWFLNTAVLLRHGACVVPKVLSAIRARSDSYSSQGLDDPVEQRTVIQSVCKTLLRPQYRDIARAFFRYPVLFSPLGRHVLPAMKRSPYGWLFFHAYRRYRLRVERKYFPRDVAGKRIADEVRGSRYRHGDSLPVLSGKPPTLSVLFANYNHASYLRDSLGAICAQTRPPDELIIVDDGSTDNSMEIIGEFAERYPFIKVIRNEYNKGLQYSINRALSMATGDYVNWAAADDKVLPQFFEKMLDLGEKYPHAGICISEYALFQDGSDVILPQREVSPVFNFSRMPEYMSPEQLRMRLKHEIVWLSTNAAIIRREALMRMGAYHNRMEWHSDWFAAQVIALRYGICILPEVQAALRARNTSYSAEGMRDPGKHRKVLDAIFAELRSPDFGDIYHAFLRHPVLLTPLGRSVIPYLARHPRLWPLLLRYRAWFIMDGRPPGMGAVIWILIRIARSLYRGVMRLLKKMLTKEAYEGLSKFRSRLLLFNDRIVNSIRYRGFPWFLRRAAFRLLSPVLWVLYWLPSWILYHANVRFLDVLMERIGHLAMEPDCYIKEGILGMRPPYVGIFLANRPVANRHLLNYWKKYLRIVTSPVTCALLSPFLLYKRLQLDISHYAVAIDTTVAYAAVETKWGDRSPLLHLTEADKRRGQECLRKLGIPPDAWFVCLHSREGGYSPHDEMIHSYRNCDIRSYASAIKAIADKGGWCIRMGDASMSKLPAMKHLIDYAHSDLKHDWMDVFLCASCRFFLGSNSGLSWVSTVFGVPSALTNLVPVSVMPFGKMDIGIPKLHWSRDENRYLSFAEIFSSPIANYRFTGEYENAGIQVMENTEEDIRDLANEMLQLLDGTGFYTPEDESLQKRYKEFFKPGHYSHGTCARVGRDFIRKYSYLIDRNSEVAHRA